MRGSAQRRDLTLDLPRTGRRGLDMYTYIPRFLLDTASHIQETIFASIARELVHCITTIIHGVYLSIFLLYLVHYALDHT